MSYLFMGVFVLGLAVVCLFQPWWSKLFNKIAGVINVDANNELWCNISYFLVICAFCFGFVMLQHFLYF